MMNWALYMGIDRRTCKERILGWGHFGNEMKEKMGRSVINDYCAFAGLPVVQSYVVAIVQESCHCHTFLVSTSSGPILRPTD